MQRARPPARPFIAVGFEIQLATEPGIKKVTARCFPDSIGHATRRDPWASRSGGIFGMRNRTRGSA